MKRRSVRFRMVIDFVVKFAATLAALGGVCVFGWILVEIFRRGLPALRLSFFTHLPTPPGISGGGVMNALLGTLVMTALAACLGIPAGVLAGVYLSEFARESRFGAIVRFLVNVLIGIPSIILGLFVCMIVVVPVGHFSGYAGVLALTISIFPLVTRITEEMLGSVPHELREASLCIGSSQWLTTRDILFRSARKGLLSGILLAVARVSGETAPLLFTALNSPYLFKSLNEPLGNLTVTIFHYAMSPSPERNQIAWGGALVILLMVLTLNLAARFWMGSSKTHEL